MPASFLNQLPVAIAALDRDFRFRHANPHFLQAFGLSQHAILGLAMSEVMPDVWRGLEGMLRQVLASGNALSDVEVSGEVPSAPGQLRHWLASMSAVTDESNAVSGVGLVMMEITARKREEHALAEREELFRLFAENTNDIITLTDANGLIVYVSPSLRRILGFDPEPQSPPVVADYIHPDDLVKVAEGAARIRAGESPRTEVRHLHVDGSWRWLEIWGCLVRYKGQPCILSVSRDVSERKTAEQALESERAFLRLVIDTTPNIVAVKDRSRRFVLVNKAAAEFVGMTLTELTGTEDLELQSVFGSAEVARLHEEDMEVINLRRESTSESEFRGVDGQVHWLSTVKSPLVDPSGGCDKVLIVATDLTAQKKLESQLAQSQKMEAVGRLAGGIAHDFNNLLTVITGYCDLLMRYDATPVPMLAPIKAISDSADRAASLTRQLLAFSRQTVLEPRVLDLNAVITETEKLLRRMIGEDIILATVLDPRISRVKVDPGQLTQVVMNLAVNARDAMPKGGNLSIETANWVLDERYAATHVDVQPGRYVMLAVTDSGVGMTPQIKARIFEPFFTTKDVGQGTGLGLAMVHGIVKQSGGHVEVYSEVGLGTTFKIYLPAVGEPTSDASEQNPSTRQNGTETILLVEDDDGVRELALIVLCSHGYTVFPARNGAEAMDLVNRGNVFDLVVTDVVMPGMDGAELTAALRARFPALRVLYSSGYTDDAVVRHGILHEKVAFLQKPYTPAALLRKVRMVLEQE